MRKILLLLFTLLLMMTLMACSYKSVPTVPSRPAPSYPPLEKPSFIAKVLEIYDTSCLVRPVTSAEEFRCADKFIVPMYYDLDLVPGEYVVVKYGGKIMETYPARLGSADITRYTEAIVDLPWLARIETEDKALLEIELAGLTKDEIRDTWGKPYGMMNDVNGDTWFGGLTREVRVNVYYNDAQHFARIEILDEPLNYRNFEYTYLGTTNSGEPFYLSLCTNGLFDYGEGNPGHYLGMGYWHMSENDLLCLQESDTSSNEITVIRTNYFRIRGVHLIWVADGSDGFPGLQLSDGNIFPAVYRTK